MSLNIYLDVGKNKEIGVRAVGQFCGCAVGVAPRQYERTTPAMDGCTLERDVAARIAAENTSSMPTTPSRRWFANVMWCTPFSASMAVWIVAVKRCSSPYARIEATPLSASHGVGGLVVHHVHIFR